MVISGQYPQYMKKLTQYKFKNLKLKRHIDKIIHEVFMEEPKFDNMTKARILSRMVILEMEIDEFLSGIKIKW